MRLPEIQHRLRRMALELNRLADEISRRPALDKAPVRSRVVTPALAAQIRIYKVQNPDMSQQEIGARFHVNAGRVSEILNGKRT
jgi:hypothetical protein